MSEPTRAAKRPGAELDAWVRQCQTLSDLTAFVEAHGPAAKTPLPVLNWAVGPFRSLSADLPSFVPDAERMATLHVYARALGAVVASRVAKDRTVYTLRGRIGRRKGPDKQPRTSVIIQATVWRPLDDEPDGCA